MYKPKSCGDLGLRDLQMVNLTSLVSGIENIVGVTVVQRDILSSRSRVCYPISHLGVKVKGVKSVSS